MPKNSLNSLSVRSNLFAETTLSTTCDLWHNIIGQNNQTMGGIFKKPCQREVYGTQSLTTSTLEDEKEKIADPSFR